jgi:hypothetical protein
MAIFISIVVGEVLALSGLYNVAKRFYDLKKGLWKAT